MAVAALLVLVLVLLPSLLLVAAVAGGIAWLATGPMTDEPPARARTRRVSATAAVAAAAAAWSLLLLGLGLGLGLRAPQLLDVVPLVAALPYLGLVLLGESLRGRRRSTRRTGRLAARRPALPPSQRLLAAVLGGALPALVAAELLLGPMQAALVVVVLGLLLGAVSLLSVRWILSAPPETALDPEVADSARERATFRILRTSAASAVLGLGAALAAAGPVVALVVGLVLVAAAAVVAFLRPPRLALRPDRATDDAPPPTIP